MESFKFIVDVLSSITAIIAILTASFSLFKNSQSAIKVERVVIHKNDTSSSYIMVIKNSKSYPVRINQAECYTKIMYKVEKKNNQRPEYMEALSLKDNVFIDPTGFEIAANGHTDIRIQGGHVDKNISKILFSFQTSHGYHQQWCKKIIMVNLNKKPQVFGMDFMYDTDSKLKAKAKYTLLTLRNIFKI